MIELKKGTKIICPNCKDHIADLKIELKENEVLLVEQFEWKNQEFENGDITNCKKCDCPWFKWGKIHTENGWKPEGNWKH